MKDYYAEMNRKRRRKAVRDFGYRSALIAGGAALSFIIGAAFASAATVDHVVVAGSQVWNQNDKQAGTFWNIDTVKYTFSQPYATPCGNGDWSGCGYQAGGVIMAVNDIDACGGWCGQEIGRFSLGPLSETVKVMFSATEWMEKGFAHYVIHFTDQSPVTAAWEHVKTVDAPAPVPLPASAYLIATGFGALALVKRRRVSKFFDDIAQQRGAGEGKSGWV